MLHRTMALIVALAVTCGAAVGQDSIDFSDVGMYGQDFEVLDFTCLKFYGPRDEETYEKYAQRIRDADERGQFVLVCLYTYDRVTLEGPIEDYLANTDDLLQHLPLELIDIVCPSEENIAWNNGLAVQNALYDHIKENYDLTVYQWFTPYDTPHAKVRADGWIIDPYRLNAQEFRKYLMKYVATGLPVINCINASPEIEPWSSSQDQVDVCREFNIPMFFYAVDGIHGSPYVWMQTDEPRLARWRGWFFRVREMCHETDTSRLPLPSANWSYGQPVEVAGDQESRFEYADDFLSQKFIDDATIDGFLALRWDGWEERLGLLGGESASLTYHLWSAFEMRRPVLAADFQPVEGAEATLSASWSADGHTWHEMTAGQPLADFGGQNLWVRLAMSADGPADQPAAWLSDLTIGGETVPPEERAVRIEPVHRGGRFEWIDDFQAPRSMHLAQIDGARYLNWDRGRVWVQGQDGETVRSTLRWHFTSERPFEEVRIAVETYSHRSLAAHNEIGVSLDGEELLISETTGGREDASGRYVGTISFNLSEDERFKGATDFWVHVTMINAARKQTNRSNSIRRLEVTGVLGEEAQQ
ncbi:MAG: hypothetical protein ACP5KN_07975 [Armatimonadota bacterium]